MYKLVFVLGLSFILGGCFWGTRMSSDGATSEVSSISIKKPANLPASHNNGGYSLCIERADHSDGGCSDSKLIENKWSASSVVNYDLKNNCKEGYKIKMWLWKDGSENSKKDRNTVYVLNSATGADLKDGYAEIPKSKLTGGEIDLKFTFRKMNGGGDIITSSSADTNVKIEVTVEDDNNTSEASDSSKENSSPKANMGTSGSDYFTCNIQDTNSSGSSGGSSDDKKVTLSEAGWEEVANLNQVSKYPALVIYGYKGCPGCNDEENFLKQHNKQVVEARKKGKVYLYHIDIYQTSTRPHCATAPSNQQGSVPQKHFYLNKDNMKECFVGVDTTKLRGIIGL